MRRRDATNDVYLLMFIGGLALCILGSVLLAKSNPTTEPIMRVEVVR